MKLSLKKTFSRIFIIKRGRNLPNSLCAWGNTLLLHEENPSLGVLPQSNADNETPKGSLGAVRRHCRSHCEARVVRSGRNFLEQPWHYLQHEDTGTLMASAIHTMSIQLMQTGVPESTMWPELLLSVGGSWVVAGTCLFRKLPLAVDDGSELFPWASAPSTELLLDSSPPNAVTFSSPRGAPSVPLPRTTWSRASSVVVSLGAVWLSGRIVVLRLISVGVVEVDVGGVGLFRTLSCKVLDATVWLTDVPLVGGSFTLCTSLEVMACCAVPRACFLSFRPSAGSASMNEEEREAREEWSRLGSVGSSELNFCGPMCCAASASPLSVCPELDIRARGLGAPLTVDSTSMFGTTVLGELGLLLLACSVLTLAGLWTWGTLTNLCM